jgi:hypothetical protein
VLARALSRSTSRALQQLQLSPHDGLLDADLEAISDALARNRAAVAAGAEAVRRAEEEARVVAAADAAAAAAAAAAEDERLWVDSQAAARLEERREEEYRCVGGRLHEAQRLPA